MTRIILGATAQREYKKLPKEARITISEIFLGEFAHNPFSPTLDIKKLRAPFVGYRLRSGQYRVLFTFASGTVYVYKIRNRKDAYK